MKRELKHFDPSFVTVDENQPRHTERVLVKPDGDDTEGCPEVEVVVHWLRLDMRHEKTYACWALAWKDTTGQPREVEFRCSISWSPRREEWIIIGVTVAHGLVQVHLGEGKVDVLKIRCEPQPFIHGVAVDLAYPKLFVCDRLVNFRDVHAQVALLGDME